MFNMNQQQYLKYNTPGGRPDASLENPPFSEVGSLDSGGSQNLLTSNDNHRNTFPATLNSRPIRSNVYKRNRRPRRRRTPFFNHTNSYYNPVSMCQQDNGGPGDYSNFPYIPNEPRNSRSFNMYSPNEPPFTNYNTNQQTYDSQMEEPFSYNQTDFGNNSSSTFVGSNPHTGFRPSSSNCRNTFSEQMYVPCNRNTRATRKRVRQLNNHFGRGTVPMPGISMNFNCDQGWMSDNDQQSVSTIASPTAQTLDTTTSDHSNNEKVIEKMDELNEYDPEVESSFMTPFLYPLSPSPDINNPTETIIKTQPPPSPITLPDDTTTTSTLPDLPANRTNSKSRRPRLVISHRAALRHRAKRNKAAAMKTAKIPNNFAKDDLNVTIVDTGHEREMMTTEKVDCVKHLLGSAVETEQARLGFWPLFEAAGLAKGKFRVSCRDEKTKDWLVGFLPTIEPPWKGAQLRAFSRRELFMPRVCAFLPYPEQMMDDDIMFNIAGRNSVLNIGVETWKVVKSKWIDKMENNSKRTKGHFVVFGLPLASFKLLLSTKPSLYWMLQKVKVKTYGTRAQILSAKHLANQRPYIDMSSFCETENNEDEEQINESQHNFENDPLEPLQQED